MARFAPSPTGPLHLGSLLAAVGSYLDARAAGARWLVRIEDLDTPRVVPGCADADVAHPRSLRLRVGWRSALPEHAARGVSRSARDARGRRAHLRVQLFAQGSRGRSTTTRQGYPGTCRAGPTQSRPDRAALPRERCGLSTSTICSWAAAFRPRHLRRRGRAAPRWHLASYQLAVVVDDAFQEVTRVVRGADLLREHAVADRSAAGAGAAHAYLRTPAAAARAGRRQTIQVAPMRYRSTRHAASQAAHLRPLRICRRPHPRTGRLLY